MDDANSQTRAMNRGFLEEAKNNAARLRFQIDTIWKGLMVHAQPLDIELRYTERIEVDRLEAVVADLRPKLLELRSALKEIKRLEAELGGD